MEDEAKSKEQLINELIELRKRLAELEVYKKVLDQHPVCTIIYDNSGKVVYRSNKSKLLDEYEKDELLGLTREEYLEKLQIEPGKVNKKAYPKYESKNFNDGIFALTETTLLTKNGEQKNVLLIGDFIYNNENLPLGVCGCAIDISEYVIKNKKVQNELEVSEERFRLLFNNVNDAIFMREFTNVITPGKFIEVNNVFCERLSYTREELLNLTPRDIVSPENLPKLPSIAKRLVTEKKAIFEDVHISKTGKNIPVEVNANLFEFKGRPIVLSIARDISERKKTEEALRIERKRLFSILDNLGAFVYLQAPDYRIHFSNKIFWEYFGKPKNKLCYEVLLNRKKPCEDCKTFRVFKRRRYQDWEWTMGGHTFKIYNYPFTDYDGTPLVLVLGMEITESKRQEEKIMFQASLLEQVCNAIFSTDLNGKIIYINNFAEKMFKYKAEEFIGKNILKLVLHDNKETLRKIIDYIINNHHWEGELDAKRKDGSTFPVRFSVTLNKNSEGEPIGMVGVGNDITEQKKFEIEMTRLSRLNLIGEMAAGIAHEIRNPMTTVRGLLQMLSIKKDNEQHNEYYKIMIEELDRANSIITEFLSLARSKTEDLKLQSLNTIIQSISPLIMAEAMNFDMNITLYLGEVPDLLLNDKEIRQLILNLTRNGFEAMLPGGNLIIRTYVAGDEAVLSVEDNGKGIDPTINNKIGIPFFTTKKKGTGLGVAVCNSIAARHNAKINMESNTMGTTFYVRLQMN